MYIVKLSGTFSDTEFRFINWDDATNFAGMAIEYGREGVKHVQATLIYDDERGLENE